MSEERWLNIYLKTVRVCAYLLMVLVICGAIVYSVYKCGFPALLLIVGAATMVLLIRECMKI